METTELHWPRRATFVERPHHGEDGQERRFEGPGTFEVPAAHADHYLDRGWQIPVEDQSAPPEATQESTSASDDQEAELPDGEESADASEVMVDESDVEGFDAGSFVDRSWQAVTSDIEDGVADSHLDAVEAAEQNRESGPRDSVIESIQEREGKG